MFIKLTGGYYQSRSIPSAAQRCVNLYPEATPPHQGEPLSYVDYETPGLKFKSFAPAEACRCAYTASNGDLWMVYGQNLYFVDRNWSFHLIGTLKGSTKFDLVPRYTPVTIADNGVHLLIVDGSTDGWTVEIATKTFKRIDPDLYTTAVQDVSAIIISGTGYSVDDILDLTGTNGAKAKVVTVSAAGAIVTIDVIVGGSPTSEVATPVACTGGSGTGATFTLDYTQEQQQAGFQGSPMVTYQDSFFILSMPNTSEFYISGTQNITFDAGDYESKNAKADNIVGVLSCHRVLWIVGDTSYEVWYNSGGSGTIIDHFPFSLSASGFANTGCIAPGSLKTANNEIYWLGHDTTGRGIVYQGQPDYSLKRVSTFAIENELRTYPTLADATAYLYNQNAHQFYMITFPSANDYKGKTWCFDTATELWHERVFNDSNGIDYRHNLSFATNAYDTIVGGDWASNRFFELSLDTYNDFGNPIIRRRTFPHSIDTEGQRRVSYRQLTVFMDTGTSMTPSENQVPVTVCTFTAQDGTLLQDYDNPSDIGSTFTKLLGTADGIINLDELVGSDGDALYQVSGLPDTPDYSVQFKVLLTDYNTIPPDGSNLYVIGRAATVSEVQINNWLLENGDPWLMETGDPILL